MPEPPPRRRPRRAVGGPVTARSAWPALPGASPYDDAPWLSAYPDRALGRLDVPPGPLPALLDSAADRYGERTALVFLGRRVGYAELRRQVDAFAAALAGLGIGRGDRVAVVLPNCPQAVLAALAALRLGAVVVQHDPLAPAEELGRQLADSGATVAVCLDEAVPTVAGLRERTALRHVVAASQADHPPRRGRLSLRPAARRARRGGGGTGPGGAEGLRVRRLADLLRQPCGPVRQADVDAERDIALIQYTSGTSGPPRGAMLTHRNLVANAAQLRAWLPDAGAGAPVVLGALPLSSGWGFTLCLTTSLLLGGTLVLPSTVDHDGLLAAVAEHRPTFFPTTAPMARTVLETARSRGADLRSVRLTLVTGGPLSGDVRDGLAHLTGGRVVEAYGLTECSPLTHAEPVAAPRPGTVGVPLPGTRARLVDVDDPSRDVPVGRVGQLVVTGPQLFAGYWRRPRETRAALTPEGHLLTGDLAVMDDDGFFTLVDGPSDRVRVPSGTPTRAGRRGPRSSAEPPRSSAEPPRSSAEHPAQAAPGPSPRRARVTGASPSPGLAASRKPAARPAARPAPTRSAPTPVIPPTPGAPGGPRTPASPAGPRTPAAGRDRATPRPAPGRGEAPAPARRAAPRGGTVTAPAPAPAPPTPAPATPPGPRARRPAAASPRLAPRPAPGGAPGAVPSADAMSTSTPAAGGDGPSRPAVRRPRRAAVPPFRPDEVVDAGDAAVVLDNALPARASGPPAREEPAAGAAGSAPVQPEVARAGTGPPHRTGARRVPSRRRARPEDLADDAGSRRRAQQPPSQ